MIVKKSEIHGLGCFADKQYEHGDMISFCPYKKIYGSIMSEIPENEKKYLFYDRGDYLYPDGDIKYANHYKYNNADIQIDKKYIYLVANQTIKKGEEITIDYGEGNIDFTV